MKITIICLYSTFLVSHVMFWLGYPIPNDWLTGCGTAFFIAMGLDAITSLARGFHDSTNR